MSVTLNHLLQPFQPFWYEPGTEEFCINEPNVVWIWRRGRFERHEIEFDADDIEDLGHAAGAQWRKDISAQSPLLGCDLPGDGRLQIVLPPCVRKGRPSLTIRVGDEEWPTLGEYVLSGFFKKTSNRPAGPSVVDLELAEYYKAMNYGQFFYRCAQVGKSILGVGKNASGKTRFSKALIGEVPLDVRLITVEDAAELKNLPQPNSVSLYYNKEAKGNGDGLGPTAVQLVEAALRMRIGRLFFQELRDGQSMLAFFTALQTGHAGGITTLHAASPEEALKRMKVMMKGTDAGRGVSDEDIMDNLYSNVDVICHFDYWGAERWMSEVWFRPVSTGEIS